MSWKAYIKQEPATAALQDVFGDALYVTWPMPEIKHGCQPSFTLDISKVTVEQRARLVALYAEAFNWEPEKVDRLFVMAGILILQSALIVSYEEGFRA